MAVPAILATAAAIKHRDKRLRAYLTSEVIAIISLETILLRGWHGYVAAYLILRPANFAMALWLAEPTRYALVFAGMCFASLMASLPRPYSLYAVTAAVQGSLYLVAGVSIKTWRVLGLMWTWLALFNFAFAGNWALLQWARLNEWWQAAMCSWLLLVLALQGRQEQSSEQP